MNNVHVHRRYLWCGNTLKSCFIATGLFLLISLMASSSLRAQSCQRLILPHNPPMGKFNPDSVMVDTCSNEIYTRSSFRVLFEKDYFRIPASNRRDTTIIRTWQDIDTAYSSTVTVFQTIDSIFGNYYFIKIYPDIDDTSYLACKYFQINFESYVNVDSVLTKIEQQLSQINNRSDISYFQSYYELQNFTNSNNANNTNATPPTREQIPNLELLTGLPDLTKIDAIGTNYHRTRLGTSWNLYKMKVPLAWEITHGDQRIVFVNFDESIDPAKGANPPPGNDGKPEWSEQDDMLYVHLGHDDDDNSIYPTGDIIEKTYKQQGNNFTITNSTNGNWLHFVKSDGKTPFLGTSSLCETRRPHTSHGSYSVSTYNARKNNRGIVGVAPGCKIITTTEVKYYDSSGTKLVAIDVNPLTNSMDRPAGVFSGWATSITQGFGLAMSNGVIPIGGSDGFGNSLSQNKGRANMGVKSINIGLLDDGRVSPLSPTTCSEVIQGCKNALPWDIKTKLVETIVTRDGEPDLLFFRYLDNTEDDRYMDGFPENDERRCSSYVAARLDEFNLQYRTIYNYNANTRNTLCVQNENNGIAKYSFEQKNFPSIMIPGLPTLLASDRHYQKSGGTSSFLHGQMAGIVALMRSVSYNLNVPTNTTDYGLRVSERAYDIVTFTGQKKFAENLYVNYWDGVKYVTDKDKYQIIICDNGGKFAENNNIVQVREKAIDPLARSYSMYFAHGLVDAFRCVAHAIPDNPNGATTSNVRFKYESSNSLDWTNAALLDKTNHTVNSIDRKVLHLGKYYQEGLELLRLDYTAGSPRGGHVFRKGMLQEPIYKNGNGKTIVNTTLNVGGSATEEQVLAIDGIMTSDNTQGGKIQTTANSTGKILATGYLDNVIYEGNVKLSDLKIIGDEAKAGITFKAPANKQGEIYGEVELHEYAFMNCESGKTVIRPGGIVRMKGTKDIVVKSGAVLEMDYASEIYSDLTSGQKIRKIIVEDGGILRVPERARAVIMDCIVEVKKGGKFIMEEQSAAFINQFFVDSAALFLLEKGTTLQLGPTVSECRGHFVSYGKENHWDETPNAPVSNPSPGFDERVIITGKKSYCGEPDITSRINFDYDLGQLPADPALVNATDKLPLLKKLGASFKMKYTNVSNVSLNIKNVYMEKLEFNKFDANQNLIAIEGINSISGKKYFDAVNISYIIDNETFYNNWSLIERMKRIKSLKKMDFGKIVVNECSFKQHDAQTGADNWKKSENLRYTGLNILIDGPNVKPPTISANSFDQWLNGIHVMSFVGEAFVCTDNVFTDNSTSINTSEGSGKICNNTFTKNRYGVWSNNANRHYIYNNTFEESGFANDFWGSAEHKVRNNTFTNHCLAVGMKNSISDITGYEIVSQYINNQWVRRRIYFGRNTFNVLSGTINTDDYPFYGLGAVALSDVYYRIRTDYSFMRCGLNDLTSQYNSHLFKDDRIVVGADIYPLNRAIDVYRNKWNNNGSFVVRRNNTTLVPIAGNSNLNVSEPSESGCGILYATDCIPDPIDVSDPPTHPFALGIRFDDELIGLEENWQNKQSHTQAEWNQLFSTVLSNIRDSNLHILNRKESMFDALRIMKIADTSEQRLWSDSVIIVLSGVINTVNNDAYLQNSALKLRAMTYEYIGSYTQARNDYISILNNYHNQPDSIHAVWGKLKNEVFIEDTNRGKKFDSLMIGYRDRVLRDRFAFDIPPDTSLAKRGTITGVKRPYKLSVSTLRPHPVTGSSDYSVTLPEKCHTVIEVQDIMGHTIVTLYNDILAEGEHILTFHKGNIVPGTYSLYVRTSCGIISQYFVIMP